MKTLMIAFLFCASLLTGCAVLDGLVGVGDDSVATGDLPVDTNVAINATTRFLPPGLTGAAGVLLTALATSYRGARRRKAVEKKLADHPDVSDELAIEVKDMLTSLLLPKKPTA